MKCFHKSPCFRTIEQKRFQFAIKIILVKLVCGDQLLSTVSALQGKLKAISFLPELACKDCQLLNCVMEAGAKKKSIYPLERTSFFLKKALVV